MEDCKTEVQARIKVPRKTKAAIIMLGVFCVILAALLAVSFLYINKLRNQSVSAMSKIEQQQKTMEEDMIPLDVFKQHSNQYSVGIPFLQSFFDDVIVYKNDTGVVYEPVDDSLPKNNYDFSVLTYQNSIAQYADKNGVTAKNGIDVSKHQGKIDWKAVKDFGIEYAFIRTGYRGYETGVIMKDEYCDQNLKGASEAGIDMGVYFYSQAVTVEEAEEEAAFVLDSIKDYDIKYPVVFDMEETGTDNARTAQLSAEQKTDITIAFCEKVKAAGYTPMIYGNIEWMMDHVELERLTQYPKWFAQYFNKPFFPYEFQMWQYTNEGSVPGIEGGVDLNLCFFPAAADKK